MNTEGPRSFARFLEQVGDGDCHTEASQLLHELTMAMQREAVSQGKKVKGQFKLELEFEMEAHGAAVRYKLNVKKPAPRRPGSFFFVSRQGGNLTVENQRQARLPLQEVPAPRDAAEAPLPEEEIH